MSGFWASLFPNLDPAWAWRRRMVFALNIATYLGMLWVAARILGSGGWTAVDVILFVCFVFGTPWTVLGFWNSLIGLWLTSSLWLFVTKGVHS